MPYSSRNGPSLGILMCKPRPQSSSQLFPGKRISLVHKRRQCHRTRQSARRGRCLFQKWAGCIPPSQTRKCRRRSAHSACRVGITREIVRIARRNIAEFETAQRIKAAKIITVVKRHIAATRKLSATPARPTASSTWPAEKTGEIPGGLGFQFVISGVADAEFRVNFRPLAVIRQFRAVARVIGQRRAETVVQMIAGLIEMALRNISADI